MGKSCSDYLLFIINIQSVLILLPSAITFEPKLRYNYSAIIAAFLKIRSKQTIFYSALK